MLEHFQKQKRICWPIDIACLYITDNCNDLVFLNYLLILITKIKILKTYGCCFSCIDLLDFPESLSHSLEITTRWQPRSFGFPEIQLSELLHLQTQYYSRNKDVQSRCKGGGLTPLRLKAPGLCSRGQMQSSTRDFKHVDIQIDTNTNIRASRS